MATTSVAQPGQEQGRRDVQKILELRPHRRDRFANVFRSTAVERQTHDGRMTVAQQLVDVLAVFPVSATAGRKATGTRSPHVGTVQMHSARNRSR